MTINATGAGGAAPLGTTDEAQAALAVRQMFSAIAPRYDLLNHLLSFNMDRVWWRRAARSFAPILQQNGARILDLCCGTGDMGVALARVRGPGRAQIIGADFSHAMLIGGADKSRRLGFDRIEADALRLPLPDASFDLVVSTFGFRNLANYDAGLREIARVLKPGAEIGILECGVPHGPLAGAYHFYFRRIVPRIGALVSGQSAPYRYLPYSVERFPTQPEMLARMRAAGFERATWTPYTFGVVGLFQGQKI